MKKNPTKDDMAICPFCDSLIFHLTDANRCFCKECKKEIRISPNFQGGKLDII